MHLQAQVIPPHILGLFCRQCEKGAFTDEDLSAHLILADLTESHFPSQYFWGLFINPLFENSLWRAFPPTLGLPPDVPTSATICTSCQVSDDLGSLPTCSSLPVLSSLQLI